MTARDAAPQRTALMWKSTTGNMTSATKMKAARHVPNDLYTLQHANHTTISTPTTLAAGPFTTRRQANAHMYTCAYEHLRFIVRVLGQTTDDSRHRCHHDEHHCSCKFTSNRMGASHVHEPQHIHTNTASNTSTHERTWGTISCTTHTTREAARTTPTPPLQGPTLLQDTPQPQSPPHG